MTGGRPTCTMCAAAEITTGASARAAPTTGAKAPAPTATAPASASSGAAIPSGEPRDLAAGTDIRATLDTPLSTRTARVGDRFTATVSAPVHDSAGNILVPLGSKVNGQISEPTDEKLASAIKDMGHLNLRFTDIQLPSGTDIPINATLLSVHTTKGGRPFGVHSRTPQTSNVIGTNAGMAGTFGPPLKGLAVGNQAGGGFVLATNRKQVELPAECGLRLRIDHTTPVP